MNFTKFLKNILTASIIGFQSSTGIRKDHAYEKAVLFHSPRPKTVKRNTQWGKRFFK